MLSYQHAYHAGNLADIHKHALLAWMLDYMTRKDKPLSYLETHAGRGLYDLSGEEARKTGEAQQGVVSALDWFAADHPYRRAVEACRAAHGPAAYPGSPWIAGHLLRGEDVLHLAELHPAEHAALSQAMTGAHCIKEDGFAVALSRTPPTPRRGLLVCDPSYEVKTDYQTIPDILGKLHRRWPVGVLVLWYPILTTDAHRSMTRDLDRRFPQAFRSEVGFQPARPGHGMIGSGLFVINPPFGLSTEAARLAPLFAAL